MLVNFGPPLCSLPFSTEQTKDMLSGSIWMNLQCSTYREWPSLQTVYTTQTNNKPISTRTYTTCTAHCSTGLALWACLNETTTREDLLCWQDHSFSDPRNTGLIGLVMAKKALMKSTQLYKCCCQQEFQGSPGVVQTCHLFTVSIPTTPW